MPDRTSYPPGTFSWAELATSDIDAAKEFYATLFGWEAREDPIPGGGSYTMFLLRGRAAAGGMTAGPEQGPPHWNAYITVADADEAAARAAELGATVLAPAFDVMEAGRMAVVQDPTGAVLSLWQAKEHIGSEVANEHGAITWNDLETRDPETAQPFYRDLFGFEFERVEQAPIPYWNIALNGRGNGGMAVLGDEMPDVPPHWSQYFGVDDIEAACATARQAGGRVIVEPTSVPTGRFAILQDPQGATFSVFAGKFDD
jgi:predicted enzyme related to lactoylglutathione lyase